MRLSPSSFLSNKTCRVLVLRALVLATFAVLPDYIDHSCYNGAIKQYERDATMSDEQPQRSTGDNADAWRAHWKAQGQPWRTEPEVDAERQQFLAERRAVQPDIEQGIYPFRNENGSIKLIRADVEWLLATHESGGMRGPVDVADPGQHGREGLDLRGADLVNQDLFDLPLAHLRGGLGPAEVSGTTREQREMATAHLQASSLARAHVEGASLRRAHLEGADLTSVHLEGAYLHKAHLEGAYLRTAHLEGADLQLAFFDTETALDNVVLGDERHGFARLVDVHWGGVNLAVVNWVSVQVFGDEWTARQRQFSDGKPKDADTRLKEYATALRANRQLAAVLRGQGLSDEADHFAYHAQVLWRSVLRRQGQWGRWLFSGFLDLIAGYGYRPLRSLFA